MASTLVSALGTNIEIVAAGSGSPTVVFESGLGGPIESWRLVQPIVARETATLAWNRPGYGASGRAPAPLNLAAGARYLDAVLDAAHVTGPLVLVGHSLGGLYTRWFAARHPERVTALVQVDPTSERNFSGLSGRLALTTTLLLGSIAPSLLRRTGAKQIEAAARKGLTDLGDAAIAEFVDRYYAPAFVRLMTAELRSTVAQYPQLRDRSLGDTPLIVLAATELRAPKAMLRQRRAHLEAIAGLSTRGELRYVDGAGHIIPFDRPDAVSDAVLEVVRSARAVAA